MIKSLRIVNFKSLADVTIELGQFTCLVGMNGAGKSSVLQAFDFVHHLMIGDIDDWLEMRGWSVSDLNCKVRKESNISIELTYMRNDGSELIWSAEFNRGLRRCTKESVKQPMLAGLAVKRHLIVESGRYRLSPKPEREIAFEYQGSLLSILKESDLPEELAELRSFMRNMRSLELLSPQLLRKKARKSDTDIGMGGEKLSAYLGQIKGEEKTTLINLLKTFYPTVKDFKVSSLASGWKKLVIVEDFNGQSLETEAMHMNDGLLRILAVLAQSHSQQSLMLLDEIENGINQEIIEPLVQNLLNTSQQVLVTTHNPLILNYIPDEIARRSVQFIYKASNGESNLKAFFSIPRIAKKLDIMGAGDAFVDTDLRLLTQECVAADVKAKAEPQK